MHCSLRLSILLLATWVSASPHSAASVVRVAASPPVKSVLALPDTLSADDVEAFGGHLGETTVRAKRRGLYRSFDSMENSHTISLHELTRAACCNLGESFVTNPSVDVNYSDAATERDRSASSVWPATTCRCSPKTFPTSASSPSPTASALCRDRGCRAFK